jgi:TM2 domain-containing membrane protein YozV
MTGIVAVISPAGPCGPQYCFKLMEAVVGRSRAHSELGLDRPAPKEKEGGPAYCAPDHRACEECGAQILKIAEICPKCGVRQRSPVNKAILLLLTFFFGGIGGHKFYLGKYWQGALYLLFFWTLIPGLVALVEFFIYLFTSSERLQEKYSAHGSAVLVLVVAAVFAVFLVGVLAAVSIPAYQDYTVRARVASLNVLVTPWKMAVEEYYIEQRKLPGSQADFAVNRFREAGNKNGNVDLGPDGVLTVTFSPTAGSVAGKTMVYRVARWLNLTAGRPMIPEPILTKAPSAELRPNQTDQDSLPPYDVLDEILHRHIERHEPADQIIAAGFDAETVRRVLKLVHAAEFKRKQAAPGIKVTDRAFGTGWRMPIAAKLT